MKTKQFYSTDFNVYTQNKIEGDFIKPDENVYFDGDVEITGRLEVKCLKVNGSIIVSGSYIVHEWEEIEGSQEIGGYQEIEGYQKIGRSQEIGGRQEIEGYQKIEGYQEIGDYQDIGRSQKIEGYQEIGSSQEIRDYQEIGGNLMAESSLVQLYSNVKGEYNVKGKVFIGVCEWRETTEEEETLTCGKFIHGDIRYGKLKETGIEDDMITISGKKFSKSTIQEALKNYLN